MEYGQDKGNKGTVGAVDSSHGAPKSLKTKVPGPRFELGREKLSRDFKFREPLALRSKDGESTPPPTPGNQHEPTQLKGNIRADLHVGDEGRVRGRRAVGIECIQCGRVFLTRRDALKQGKGRYCSQRCQGLDRVDQLRKHHGSGEKNNAWKGGRVRHARGYAMVHMPSHPRAATANGYVFEHILIAEKKLGRPLVWHGVDDPRSEIVHHIDGNKRNNAPSNLEVTTFSKHASGHAALRRGRDAQIGDAA